jgi:hypothetical protein
VLFVEVSETNCIRFTKAELFGLGAEAKMILRASGILLRWRGLLSGKLFRQQGVANLQFGDFTVAPETIQSFSLPDTFAGASRDISGVCASRRMVYTSGFHSRLGLHQRLTLSICSKDQRAFCGLANFSIIDTQSSSEIHAPAFYFSGEPG